MWSPSGTNRGLSGSRIICWWVSAPPGENSAWGPFTIPTLSSIARNSEEPNLCSLTGEAAEYTQPWKSHSWSLSLTNSEWVREKNLPLPRQFSQSLLLHNSEDFQPRNIFRPTRGKQDSPNSSRISLKRCFENCTIILIFSRAESNKC